MNNPDARKLLRRLGVLAVLVACLYTLNSGAGVAANSYAAFDCYGQPAPPNYWCECGLSRPVEGSCTNPADLSTCACFTCVGVEGSACVKLGSGSCSGSEVPICDDGNMPTCSGGTWVCGSVNPNELDACANQPVPPCPYGAYCYGGNWYCGNNQCGPMPDKKCDDPTDPTGTRKIDPVCSSGIWVCGIR